MSQKKNNATTGTERKTDRLEAFTDAVLAIAITLPIVELHPPQVKTGEDLAAAYAALSPGYFSYLLSCVVIGLYWAYSHFSGKIVRETDHGFNLLTLLFVGLVSITPFPTRPFVEHLNDSTNSQTAAAVYASVLAAPASVWFLRWVYATKRGLLDPRLAPDYLRSVTIKYGITATVSIVGAVLCWLVSWQLGIGLSALVTLSFLIPPMAPQYKPGQEPLSEIQEPDEVE